MKIDHHRGPVTSVKVSSASDVLVSSSYDGTVCLWCLENYTLLNTFQLTNPIMNIQISSDSVSIIYVLCHSINRSNNQSQFILFLVINLLYRYSYWHIVKTMVYI